MEKTSPARVALAVLVSACAVSIATALCPPFKPSGFVMLFAFIIALLHAVILGIPAYLLCEQQKWYQWWASALWGFVIGMVPTACFNMRMGIISDDITITEVLAKATLEPGLFGIIGATGAWAVWQLPYRFSK